LRAGYLSALAPQVHLSQEVGFYVPGQQRKAGYLRQHGVRVIAATGVLGHRMSLVNGQHCSPG